MRRKYLPLHASTPQGPIFYAKVNIAKMLYLIGLGLSDEKDITVKGLEIVKKAARVYLENYTAVLLCDVRILVSTHFISYLHEPVSMILKMFLILV